MTLPATLEPVEMIDETLPESLYKLDNYPNLTQYEKQYVIEIVKDFISGITRTDREIAASIGCTPTGLWKLKARGVVGHVLADLLPQIARIGSPEVLHKIRNAIETDWRAGKFYLEFTGQYVQKSQQAVLHANMQDYAGNVTSPQQLTERIVQQYASLGYDIERLVSEIRGKWAELKGNGSI